MALKLWTDEPIFGIRITIFFSPSPLLSHVTRNKPLNSIVELYVNVSLLHFDVTTIRKWIEENLQRMSGTVARLLSVQKFAATHTITFNIYMDAIAPMLNPAIWTQTNCNKYWIDFIRAHESNV